MALREAEGAGGAGGEIMPAAELKPLLMLAKRQPVSCAIGLTKDKAAVILLDRRMKPRKLMADLRSQARAAGLELDGVSVRFGRASVDAASGSGTVRITVNKEAPAVLGLKLKEKLRPAGFRKCEIVVDAALEDEGDEDAPGAPEAAGTAAVPGGPAPAAGAAQGAAEPAAGASQGVSGDGPDGGVAGPAPGADAAASGASGSGAPGAAAATDADPAAGKGAAARRLAGLVQRLAAALPGNPPGADAMRAAASQGHQAVRGGDLAGAAQAADTLERLLGGAGDAAASGVAPGAAPAGGSGLDAQGPGGAGGSVSGAPVASGGADASGTPAQGAPPADARPGPASPVIAKGRQAWLAVRTKLQRDIDAVVGEVGKHYGGGDEAELVRTSYEPIMHALDDSLLAKLDEVAAAAPAARGKLAGDAQAIIARYKAFVDGSEVVTLLDGNPFHPAPIRRTLDQALAALSQAVQAGGGRT